MSGREKEREREKGERECKTVERQRERDWINRIKWKEWDCERAWERVWERMKVRVKECLLREGKFARKKRECECVFECVHVFLCVCACACACASVCVCVCVGERDWVKKRLQIAWLRQNKIFLVQTFFNLNQVLKEDVLELRKEKKVICRQQTWNEIQFKFSCWWILFWVLLGDVHFSRQHLCF